jgi:hypothetical protein
MNTATLIKMNLSGFIGDANLYRLDPPLADHREVTHEYVVVSAVYAMFPPGEETYIFASDAEGYVKDWGELDGSFRGDLDHERALRGAGYEVVR